MIKFRNKSLISHLLTTYLGTKLWWFYAAKYSKGWKATAQHGRLTSYADAALSTAVPTRARKLSLSSVMNYLYHPGLVYHWWLIPIIVSRSYVISEQQKASWQWMRVALHQWFYITQCMVAFARYFSFKLQQVCRWVFAKIVQQPEGVTLQKYPQTRLLMILV